MNPRRFITWSAAVLAVLLVLWIGKRVIRQVVLPPIVAERVLKNVEDACYIRRIEDVDKLIEPESLYAKLIHENPTLLFDLFAEFDPGCELHGTSYAELGGRNESPVILADLIKRARKDSGATFSQYHADRDRRWLEDLPVQFP